MPIKECLAGALDAAAPDESRPHTSVRSLRDRTLLFSEARQAIFELDDGAADLWDRLELGQDPAAIIANMPDANSSQRAAIAGTLEQLTSIRDAGLQGSRQPGRSLFPASSSGFVLELAQVAVELNLPAGLTGPVQAELVHLKSDATDVHARIVARERGDLIEMSSDGRQWSCSRDEFIPLLKGELLDEVLRSAAYEVALHAAALARDDRLLLLCGSPGAGKTTLAIALIRSGFDLVADDVVLLDPDGQGLGVPLPLAAKSTSWPLVATFFPDAGDQAHVRRDGQIVRYIRPEGFSPSAPPRAIGFVLFLDRQPGASAKLQDVDATDALAALIAEGTARNEQLSTAGFDALVQMLNQARCCTLRYDDLADAVRVVRGLYA